MSCDASNRLEENRLILDDKKFFAKTITQELSWCFPQGREAVGCQQPYSSFPAWDNLWNKKALRFAWNPGECLCKFCRNIDRSVFIFVVDVFTRCAFFEPWQHRARERAYVPRYIADVYSFKILSTSTGKFFLWDKKLFMFGFFIFSSFLAFILHS